MRTHPWVALGNTARSEAIMLQILVIMLFGYSIKFTLLCFVFLPLCSNFAPFIPVYHQWCQINCNLLFTRQVRHFQGLIKPIQNCRCRNRLLFSFTYSTFDLWLESVNTPLEDATLLMLELGCH